MMFEPFRCEPIYQKRVWGGRWFAEGLQRELPDAEPYGESWELSCREDAMSQVTAGRWAGKTLYELINQFHDELLGSRVRCENVRAFPLLIKFLDACDHLSIQVHPDDHNARQKMPGESGKTEMWYVLDAEPGASLILGLKDGVTPHELRNALETGEVRQYFHVSPVSAGDAIFIPAGTVHAILKGIRLAEIQQNSDTTYRIYDWGRLGLDGKPRELHIEDSLRVIDFERGCIKPSPGVLIKEQGYQRRILSACPYFAVEEMEIEFLEDGISPERFEAWMVISGTGTLRVGTDQYQLRAGETWILPAGLDNFELAGPLKLLKTYIPDLQNEIIAPLIARGFSREDLCMIGGLF